MRYWNQQVSGVVTLEQYDPADVLEKVLAVDGAGSGLDADLLHGQPVASFVQQSDLARFFLLGADFVEGGSANVFAADRLPGFDPSVNMSACRLLVSPVAGALSVRIVLLCPSLLQTYSLWEDYIFPSINFDSDNAYELGLKFIAAVNGYVTGVKFIRSDVDSTSSRSVRLWDSSGNLLGVGYTAGEAGTGWVTCLFNTPIAVVANTVYVVSYSVLFGMPYASIVDYFYTEYNNFNLTALASQSIDGNGVYSLTPGNFPTITYSAQNYCVDVIFSESISGSIPDGHSAVFTIACSVLSDGMNVRNLSVTESQPVPVPVPVDFDEIFSSPAITLPISVEAGQMVLLCLTRRADDPTDTLPYTVSLAGINVSL